jgi:hypothetical protein
MQTEVTAAEIAFAHSVRYRDAMLRAWLRRTGRETKQGASWKPEDVPVYIDVPTNEERSRAEVIEFRARPLQPGERYGAYLTGGPQSGYFISTWMGETLATVTHITHRTRRASAFADDRGSFWARGIDGRLYHGRHNGSGLYCSLYLATDQRARKGDRHGR